MDKKLQEDKFRAVKLPELKFYLQNRGITANSYVMYSLFRLYLREVGDTGRKNEFASNLPSANMLQIWNLQSFATSAKVAMGEFAQKRANSPIATFALVAKLCKSHSCNIFAPGKFGANSIFHPVRSLQVLILQFNRSSSSSEFVGQSCLVLSCLLQ